MGAKLLECAYQSVEQFHLSDGTSRRAAFTKSVPDHLVVKLFTSVSQSLNLLCSEKRKQKGKPELPPWKPQVADPGYADGKSEYKGEEAHFGVHFLYNQLESGHQQVHIDGIGHPEEISALEDFEGPLSVSIILSRHRNTQFGEMFSMGNRFSAMLDGRISADQLVAEVSEVLINNYLLFEDQLGQLKPLEEPTVNIFPKNMTVHRGLARGPALDKEEQRVAIYFTMCRENRLAEYATDKMETAELAPGFDGYFNWNSIELWLSQYLIAFEVP